MPLYFLIFVLIFAPLAYGTTGPIAMLIVQAVVLLGLLSVSIEALRKRRKFYRPPGLLPLGLLAGFMALQAVPLPPGLLEVISPVTFQRYERTVWLLQAEVWMPLSVSVERTVSALFSYLTCVGFYLLASQCLADAGSLKKVVRIVTTFAGIYALVSILEALVPNGQILWILRSWPEYAGKPFGTYVNGNHFAGLMAMLLPLCFMLYLVDKPATHYGDWKERLIDFCSDPNIGKHLLAGFAALLSATGIFLSLSRGGILSMFGAMLLLSCLLLWRKQYRRQSWLLIGFVAVLFCFVGIFGWEAIFARFASIRNLQGDIYDGRLSYWGDVLALIRDFPLFGTGFGSFLDSYAGYQSHFQSNLSVDHAHNEYFELLVEAGLTGLLLVAWVVVVIVRDSWQAFGRRRTRYATSLYLGALVGLCALLLHNLTEFNLHVGANGLYFAFMAALLVALASTSSQGRGRSELPPVRREKLRLVVPAVAIVLLGSLALNIGGLVAEAKTSSFSAMELTQIDRAGLDDALLHSREAIAWSPLTGSYRYFKAGLLAEQGFADEAMQAYGQLLRLRPLGSLYLHRAAMLAKDMQQPALAEALLKSGVELDRVDLRRIKLYAQWLFYQRQQEEGLAQVRRGLELAPNKTREFIALMRNYGLKPIEMAAAFPETALAWQLFAQDLVETHVDMLEAKRDRLAEHAYRKALQLAPTEEIPSSSAHRAFSKYLEQNQRYEEAVVVLLEAIALFPENANLHAAAGSLYERLKITYRAEEEYRQALLLNPKLGWVRKRLERMRQ